jgi:hypothetical protein
MLKIRDYAYPDRNPIRLPGFQIPGLTEALLPSPRWVPPTSTQAPAVLTRNDAALHTIFIGVNGEEQVQSFSPSLRSSIQETPRREDKPDLLGSPISLSTINSFSIHDDDFLPSPPGWGNSEKAETSSLPASPSLTPPSLLYTRKFINAQLARRLSKRPWVPHLTHL